MGLNPIDGLTRFKVAVLPLKPEVRLHAKWPSSERISQSDECKC